MSIACTEINTQENMCHVIPINRGSDYDSIVWGAGSYDPRIADYLLRIIMAEFFPVSRQKRVLEILRRNNLRTDFLEKNLHSEELQQLNRLLTVVFENAGNNICKKYFLRII